MPELVALFRFLVPYFDGLSDEELTAALTRAAPFRPACLMPAMQDEAQVWFAAASLYDRQLQTRAAQEGSAIPFGVKSEREGDVSRTYGVVEGVSDALGFWEKFNRLDRLCGGIGAIAVGTRYGSCCHADYADY